jgi:hypothetical protein
MFTLKGQFERREIMVILDKNFKFISWFNSKKETPEMKKGQIIENDISVAFVFCENEKIVFGPGHYEEDQIQDFLEKGYKMFSKSEFEWIEGETKHTLYNNNGKAYPKSEEMLLIEAKELKKKQVLRLPPEGQTLLILNNNGERESIENKIKSIEEANSIEELGNI